MAVDRHREAEVVILDGIPVVQFAVLEILGAPEASFRVLCDVPIHLGGETPHGECRRDLVRFARTGELRHGVAVFRPAE